MSPENFVGRNFEWGKTDCFSLVRDFYQETFGITLLNIARPTDWVANDLDIIRPAYPLMGFSMMDIPLRELQFGDVIMISLHSRVPNHLMIYVGEGKVLHQPYKRRSLIETYAGGWRRVTNGFLRHKDAPVPTKEETIVVNL